MPAWTCPCCCWAAAVVPRTCGSDSTRWPPSLPRLDSVVVLPEQGHLANLRAPGEVAEVIAAFADRLPP